MPYYRSRRRTRPRVRKGSKWASRSRSRRRSKVSPLVKRYVKREIARQNENKIQDNEVTGAAVNYLIDDGDVRSLLPQIFQGTTEQHRIGNRVRIKSLKLKLHLSCYNQTTSISPTYFDIYIFKFKPANFGGGAPGAGDMTLFLQDGSSSLPYNGTNILSGLRRLNDEMFTKVIKKRVALFNPQNATTQISTTSNYNPAITMYFDLTNHVKKQLMYDDATPVCMNDNLYIAIGASQTDQTGLTTVNLGQYSYLVETQFEDS